MVDHRPSARGAVTRVEGMRAPRLATTVELAFALLSWLGKRIHGKRPPYRSFICLHACSLEWSVFHSLR